MDTYAWQKNEAVVRRLYYTERVCESTYLGCTLFTMANLLYIKKGYFANVARSRILPCWAMATTLNLVVGGVLCMPLYGDEIKPQLIKRMAMGKWLYTVYHLDAENQNQMLVNLRNEPLGGLWVSLCPAPEPIAVTEVPTEQ